MCAVERHGVTGFEALKVLPPQLEAANDHLAEFRVRPRRFENPADGFEVARKKFAAAKADLGAAWACDLFFQTERESWQSRNRAAQVQYRRQQRIGLGWANHEHHIYRSNRECFGKLIEILKLMGFEIRHQFYAGAEAGWGAVVLEQLDAGLVVLAEVDLDPDEAQQELANQLLVQREAIGPIELWCRLHGEAFLEAGIHRLECRFNYDAACRQLAEDGVKIIPAKTNIPHIKQALTLGERWKVEPHRIDALLANHLISAEQAEALRDGRATGSHLGILQRL